MAPRSESALECMRRTIRAARDDDEDGARNGASAQHCHSINPTTDAPPVITTKIENRPFRYIYVGDHSGFGSGGKEEFSRAPALLVMLPAESRVR